MSELELFKKEYIKDIMSRGYTKKEAQEQYELEISSVTDDLNGFYEETIDVSDFMN